MINNVELRFNIRKGFQFKLNSHDTMTIYCSDRKKDLINGLTHEILEATIIRVMENINPRQLGVKFIRNEEGLTPLSHLITVVSMDYYGFQKKNKELYESFF